MAGQWAFGRRTFSIFATMKNMLKADLPILLSRAPMAWMLRISSDYDTRSELSLRSGVHLCRLYISAYRAASSRFWYRREDVQASDSSQRRGRSDFITRCTYDQNRR